MISREPTGEILYKVDQEKKKCVYNFNFQQKRLFDSGLETKNHQLPFRSKRVNQKFIFYSVH